MSCQRTRELIHPYIDGELELAQGAEVQQHINQCEECKLGYHNQLTLRSTLKHESLYYLAPQNLKNRIRSLLPFPEQRQQGD